MPTVSLKTPEHAGRATFAIVLRQPNGKTKTIKSEPLESINRAYKEKSLTYKQALEAAKRERQRQRRILIPSTSTVLRPINLKLLDRYWKDVYEHKNIRCPKSAYYRLKRAVEALGDVPYTADRNTLQKQINKFCKGSSSRQRAVVSALNQLLKWAGRTDVVLSRDFKDFVEPRHLSLKEFKKVVRHVDEPYATLFWVLFCTGCRPGEAFALKTAGDSVWVNNQMKTDGEPGPTKNRKRRRVPVITEGRPYLKEWVSVPLEEKQAMRNDKIAEIFTKACVKEFPTNKSKHLLAKDLRHCYAIHLISKGVSLTMVAQSLGNAVQVCQEYYAGFTLSDESLDVILDKLK